MERRNDMPPTHTVRTVDPPPDSASPTTAMLKADIDSGRTGDKTEAFDPGLSPLGTDDEAAGTPAEPHRVRLARRLESIRRWSRGGTRGAAHGHSDRTGIAYVAGIVLIGCIIVGGIILTRA